MQSEIENKKYFVNVTFFWGMGIGIIAICHILYLSHFTLGGDVLREILQVSLNIKFAGFFIYFLTWVRGMLVLISCLCLFVCLSETNLLSLRALPFKLKALSLFLIFVELISLLVGYITCMWHYPGFLVLV